MTAEEIRAIPRFISETLAEGSTVSYDGLFVVQREIAAQLATLNELIASMQIHIKPRQSFEPELVGLRVGTHQMVKP